jgi:hypothetical protein
MPRAGLSSVSIRLNMYACILTFTPLHGCNDVRRASRVLYRKELVRFEVTKWQLKFSVSAHVSSDNPSAVKPVLEQLIADKGTIRQTDQGFEVEAELEGESARDLNRMILSALRRAEKRTRIRAEWTSGDTVEKFFDYGSKGTRKA